jgi:excisionase family DNA binding protein
MAKWLTIHELAKYLKMSEAKLYKLTSSGLMPGTKVVGQWRFDQDEIDRWMLEQRSKSKDTRRESQKINN